MTKSNRQLRASSIIQKALVDVFRDGKIIDKDLEEGSFYITKVSLSKDLKTANCYIRPYDSSNQEKIINILSRSAKSIRYIMNKYIDMKFSPELRFFYDHGFDNQMDVEDIIRNIKLNN